MYKGTRDIVVQYWNAYGGSASFFKSPYLHFSLLLSVLCVNIWFPSEKKFSEMAIAVLPNLIGFSIGAFAILAQMVEKQEVLRLNIESKKVGIVFSSSFVHAILFQILAIILAIISKASIGIILIAIFGEYSLKYIFFISIVFHFISFAIFIYAILIVLSLAFTIFRIIKLVT